MKLCMLTWQRLKPSWVLSAHACRCKPSHLAFATLCYDALGTLTCCLLQTMSSRLCRNVL